MRDHIGPHGDLSYRNQRKEIILLDYLGNIYRIKDEDLILKKSDIKLSPIPSNLKDGFYLDSFILNNDLFVSYKTYLETKNVFRSKYLVER